MSMLAATISRAGPSMQKSALGRGVPAVCIQTRHASGGPPPKVIPQKKEYKIKPGQYPWKDGKGNKKQNTSQGIFRPMPASQLTHPLLAPEAAETLEMELFQPQAIRPESTGSALEFAAPKDGPAKIFGLPKQMLVEFRLLSKPCSVVRDVTVEATQMMDEAKDRSSLDTRVVLTGRRGCGKSFLLYQTVEYCKANDWVVIYIPRAVNLINSTTAHQHDLRTQTYLQPRFSFQILQRMLTVNRALLSQLRMSSALVAEKFNVPEGTSLAELVQVGVKDLAYGAAPVVLERVMRELEAQTSHPVLLAVDDFQALYCKTAYRDPQFSAIRPYHLSIPRMIMEYASGKRAFSRGALVGAVNGSDTQYELPLELRDALDTGYEHPTSPYDKRSATLMEYTKGLRALKVPEKLSVREAGAVFEVWMKDRALASTLYDETFLAKYAESGGNARDFVWKGLLSNLSV